MPSNVKDIDHGYRKLVTELLSSDDLAVTIGIQGEEAGRQDYEGTDLKNVEIAAIHELGYPSKNIPKRSFLKATIEGKERRYGNVLARALRKVVKTKGAFTSDEALRVLGVRAVADVKNTIRKHIPPALKASTIKWRVKTSKSQRRIFNRGKTKKGLDALFVGIRLAASFTPLVNDGTLKDSISFKIRKGFKGK